MNNQIDPNESFNNYLELQQKELTQERLKSMQLQNDNIQSSMYGSPQANANLVEYQLELQLEEIYHTLASHEIVTDANGNQLWAEPKDERKKMLSDYGVRQIMNILRVHVNKNTLLSKYSIEEVKDKLMRFSMAFQDKLFNEQELFFQYPKPEELFDLCKTEAKRLGITDLNEVELYNKCMDWSQEELDKKFGSYEMICDMVINIVENTYHRCVDGLERKSLREHTNISQVANQNIPLITSGRRI